MNFTLTPLSQLDPTGLDRLAILHQSVMPTLLTDLVAPFVQRYYRVCQANSTIIGLCALNSDQEVLGWAVGAPHPDALNARLRQPLPWFAAQMLRLAFTRPGVLWQLVNSVLSSSSQM